MSTRPTNITTHQLLTWIVAGFMTLATPILYWMGNTLMSVHESQIRNEGIPGQVRKQEVRINAHDQLLHVNTQMNTNN